MTKISSEPLDAKLVLISSRPSRVSLKTLAEALAGNPRQLSRAFMWRASPQGHDFWRKEKERLEKGLPLSSKARAILEATIKIWETAL